MMRAARRRPAALLLVFLLACIAACVLGSERALVADPDALLADDRFVLAELYPRAPSGSASLVAEWSEYILGLSGLLSVDERASDPNKHDPISRPNQRSTPSLWHWQRVGKVLPNDLTPLTEGYRPPLHGYFEQSAECDQFLRLWADQCAFPDAEDNVYHIGPKPFFQPGADTERKSSATYLSEMMAKWESNSAMAKSAKRFAKKEKSKDYEPPLGVDKQDWPTPSGNGGAPAPGAGGAAADGGAAAGGGEGGAADGGAATDPAADGGAGAGDAPAGDAAAGGAAAGDAAAPADGAGAGADSAAAGDAPADAAASTDSAAGGGDAAPASGGGSDAAPASASGAGAGDNSASAGSRTHTVVKGDTLWGLAKKYLGSGNRWPAIHAANKDQIKDPHWIFPGQKFVIPPN